MHYIGGGFCEYADRVDRSEVLGVLHSRSGDGGYASGARVHTEIMEHVLKDKEEEYLISHRLPGREGKLIGAHAERFRNWVEQPNLYASHKHLRNTTADEADLRLEARR